MKHTATYPTGTGTVKVSADVDYYVPRKGDTISVSGHSITLVGDMELGANFHYNTEAEAYEATPLMTEEAAPRLVFYADGVSWRKGEWFAKATV